MTRINVKPGPTARARKAKAAKRARDAKSIYALVDERDGTFCRCCGRFCGEERHQHHILYRSQGGTETTANLVTLCGLRYGADGCHEAVHAGTIQILGSDANGPLEFRSVR